MPVTGSKPLLSYSLSIRQCADGFSFLVHSVGSGGLVMQEDVHCRETESMPQTLERGLQMPRIRGRQYERVALFSTSPSTRIPLDEFRREDMLALYRVTFSGLRVKPEDIRCQVLPNLEVVELFTLQNQVEAVLRTYYPSAVVQGLYGSYLRYIASINQGSFLPVSFHAMMVEGGLFVVVLRQGKLSFANVYRAEADADKLYFMLYVWKLIGLDVWHDHCTLYGASDNLYDQVRQFLANVQTMEIPSLVNM